MDRETAELVSKLRAYIGVLEDELLYVASPIAGTGCTYSTGNIKQFREEANVSPWDLEETW